MPRLPCRCLQAQLVVALRSHARAEAEATKARALLCAAEADVERLDGDLAEARAASARARAETESLRQRSRVVLQEAREAFAAEQAAAVRARDTLEAEAAELRSALVEARDALVAVDGPQGSLAVKEALLQEAQSAAAHSAAALERLRADCDREIIIVQESYEAEVARLRASLAAASSGEGPAGALAADEDGGRLAEAERMVAWLQDELARADAVHTAELEALRQESIFAQQAAEDRAAATVAKAVAWRSVQQHEEQQRKHTPPGAGGGLQSAGVGRSAGRPLAK